MKRTSCALLCALICGHAVAQARNGFKHRTGTVPRIVVRAPWLFNRATRYAHSMPELAGAKITVTRKTTVVRLADQPPIIDNHLRELFDRLPGIVLAEQQNPTELNINYRGLGNPQESEYILLMQDGIPMEMDWIGYPTLYYIPVPESITEVRMIRGGSGLLYGPEPEPVIDFISKAPTPTTTGTIRQVGGTDGLDSTYGSLAGSAGPLGYRADFSHRHSRGQRRNGDYGLSAGDLALEYRFDSRQSVALALHAYSLQSGMAGLMSYAQWQADPHLTTTPEDRDWVSRYTAVLTYTNRLDSGNLYVQKLWSGYQALITRADSYLQTSPGADFIGAGATVGAQRFHYTGLDGRFRHLYGRGNAFTLGYTAYASNSPYREVRSSDALADPYDAAGALIYNDERRTRYAAVFAENLYRFRLLHLLLSARLDHEQLDTRETVAPHPYLVNAGYVRNIPLFGIGLGNDFGRGNETYLNISQGYRPVRYLDVASPFGRFSPGNSPDPTRYLTYEVGVHGWPLHGFYYDASLFQVNVRNRIESQQFTQTASINVNTGDTRSRGLEAESSYDLLRLWPARADGEHLTLFANASYLHARFTHSIIPGQIGKTPAYAPGYVLKAGLTLTAPPGLKLSLIVDAVGSQYMQDNDLPAGTTPARIPAYTVADLCGQYRLGRHWQVLGGITNLADHRYYSRVFLFGGLLEPALGRELYAGIAYRL